jgi:nucleoside-diphosphate-sugar epimerase
VNSPEKLHESHAQTRVLVTGASGKIGRYVVAELVARGYTVRALTSKPVEKSRGLQDGIEWRQFDWHQSLALEPLVEGCSAILHLGAEIMQMDKMQRSNVEVTRTLARAAEAAGIKFFCYISSVAVYGSSLSARVTEESPVLTVDRDIKSEYLAVEYLRAYGRTKLAGEREIREAAQSTDYVILRPTVVVEAADLIELGSWSFVKRAIAGYRHSQHIFILDVVHAIIWFMEHSLASSPRQPTVKLFNLADNDVPENTYANFFREAFLRTSDQRFNCIELPWIFDGLRDVVKFRMLPLRHSLGRMRFSTDRLHATGYRHPHGIKELHNRALDLLVGHEPR